MASGVFLMQHIGQFVAYSIGLAVLQGSSSKYGFRDDGPNSKTGIDILWRIVAGVGPVSSPDEKVSAC